MKLVYASRTGNIQSVVDQLKHDDVLKIETGKETVNEDYILFTYNDGNGVVPPTVEEFLKNNGSHMKGLISSGNPERHPTTYHFGADIIVKEYNVPVIAKIDRKGTPKDLQTIKKALK